MMRIMTLDSRRGLDLSPVDGYHDSDDPQRPVTRQGRSTARKSTFSGLFACQGLQRRP